MQRIYMGNELVAGRTYQLLRTKQEGVPTDQGYLATKQVAETEGGEVRFVVDTNTGGGFFAVESDVFAGYVHGDVVG